MTRSEHEYALWVGGAAPSGQKRDAYLAVVREMRARDEARRQARPAWLRWLLRVLA